MHGGDSAVLVHATRLWAAVLFDWYCRYSIHLHAKNGTDICVCARGQLRLLTIALQLT